MSGTADFSCFVNVIMTIQNTVQPIVLCVMLQASSASKQMVDLETKPETSTDDEKKEQTFGLRTDQYAKKGLQVVALSHCFGYISCRVLSELGFDPNSRLLLLTQLIRCWKGDLEVNFVKNFGSFPENLLS